MTYRQYKMLKDLIKKYSSVVMYLTVGGSNPDKTLLKTLGITPQDLDLIKKSFLVGDLRIKSTEKVFKNLSPESMKTLLKERKTNSVQNSMIDFAREQTGMYVSKLEGSLTSALADLYGEQSLKSVVKDTIVEGIAKTQSRNEVVTKLREKTEDYKRDWHRIAQTEMWNAKLNGEANAILRGDSPLTDDGAETLVYKRPAPDACPHCKKLYLEPNSIKPRIFKLSELIHNGTNYGVKTSDWVATLGTLHPNCACTLNVVPKGFKFDDSGDLVPEN